MIFYFSGTGNSQWVAEEIAAALNDKTVFIPFAKKEYRLNDGEKIGFVFPTYAWSAPDCVWDFIGSVRLTNVQNNYVYFVSTCHSACGAIDAAMKKALEQKGFLCRAGFSVRMPNNYLSAPFVRTDNDKKRAKLLENAREKIPEIVDAVNKNADVFDLTRGFAANFLSRFHDRFMKNMTVSAFYATDDCTRCWTCETACPMENITLKDKPVWGDNCQKCMACLNRCPQGAIQYGRFTKGKKRYVFSKDFLKTDD